MPVIGFRLTGSSLVANVPHLCAQLCHVIEINHFQCSNLKQLSCTYIYISRKSILLPDMQDIKADLQIGRPKLLFHQINVY